MLKADWTNGRLHSRQQRGGSSEEHRGATTVETHTTSHGKVQGCSKLAPYLYAIAASHYPHPPPPHPIPLHFSNFLGVVWGQGYPYCYSSSYNCSVGNYIGLRRRQDADNGYAYNLSHYVKELKEGEVMDPEHSNGENVELALRNMIKTSDALQMVR